MKKCMISWLLVLVVSVFSVSANTSVNLNLFGYVGEPPSELSLTISRTPEQEEPIDLTLDAVERAVGTLNAFTNGPGYKVSVISVNGYNLIHDGAQIPYTFHISGDADWTNPSWVNPGDEVDFQHWATEDTVYPLAVSLTGVDPTSYPTGTYSDTLTFTIKAE